MNANQTSMVPMVIQWKPVVGAALIVFLVFEMLMVGMIEGTPWGPPRMMAAIVLGKDVRPPPATFEFGVVTDDRYLDA